MDTWASRSTEIANLLNPAFCGVMLSKAIVGYWEKSARGMPVSLAYLVLPMVLHKATREQLPKSVATSLFAWMEANPELRMGFPERTKAMVPFTNEGLLMLYSHGYLSSSERKDVLKSCRDFSATGLRIYSGLDEEVKEIVAGASLIGRVFARAASPATIYAALGVRP